MKRGRDELKTYSVTVIQTGENLEYCDSLLVGVAEGLTKDQLDYCREFIGTCPTQRRDMFVKMWENSGKGWPFERDRWKTGNAIFTVDEFDDIEKFKAGYYETDKLQPWFKTSNNIKEVLGVPRNNHAVIWINLSE